MKYNTSDVLQYDNFFDRDDWEEIKNKTGYGSNGALVIHQWDENIQSINTVHHSGRLILLKMRSFMITF